jgi:hypothetical protein
MKSLSTTQYVSYALILTLAGSIFSVVMPYSQLLYAATPPLTVSITDDAVTKTYGPNDTVGIVGVADFVSGKTSISIKIEDQSGSTIKSTTTTVDEDTGEFDYAYDIPGSADDGAWTVHVTYNGDDAYTYFIVDDVDDTISVELDNSDGQYVAGDEVTVTGQVDNKDSSEDSVIVTVMDPTNDKIVDQEDSLLGEGSLASDEFKYSFNLDDHAGAGRYAVIVTYDVDNQAGSNLFEIPAEDNGGSSSNFSGDTDTDGDVSAQVEKDSYDAGDNVAIEGSIDSYDSSDNEDLAIVIENPNGDKVTAYSDSSATVKSNGDFNYDFDLEDNADAGTYTVTLSYINDEAKMTFDVKDSSSTGGSGSGSGGTTSGDLTVKLDKSSYKAGETMIVSGKVKHVADPKDEETVNILLYKPSGEVILSAAKYVTPSSTGDFSASVLLSSSLEVKKGYRVVVSYLEDEAEIKIDITGVSSNPVDKITVKTDTMQYVIGSTVKISGSVPSSIIVDGQQLLLRVNTPDGNPCRIDPVDVTSNGAFSYNLVLGGKCGVNGQYDVEATYNQQKSKATFVVTGSSRSAYGLSIAGKTYSIEYEMSGGSVKSMFARASDNKLVVNLDAQQDGKLTLVLPRAVIDSIKDGKDIKYIVTIEDNSGTISTIQANETGNTGDARTLVIDYGGGAARVEIAGTQVVPEFGAMAGIIMAGAIVGIIFATARFGSKLSLFRR